MVWEGLGVTELVCGDGRKGLQADGAAVAAGVPEERSFPLCNCSTSASARDGYGTASEPGPSALEGAAAEPVDAEWPSGGSASGAAVAEPEHGTWLHRDATLFHTRPLL